MKLLIHGSLFEMLILQTVWFSPIWEGMGTFKESISCRSYMKENSS
jgi:hypothetical protein